MIRLAPAILLLLASLPVATARSHERSLSHSRIEIDGARAEIRLSIGARDLTRLPLSLLPGPEREGALAEYLVRALRLESGGEPCPAMTAAQRGSGAPGRSVHHWEVACSGTADYEVVSELLAAEAPHHLHFARVSLAGGEPRERILTEGRRRFSVATDPKANAQGDGPGFLASLRLGIEHIASGTDHLAFLLALLLLAASLRQVAVIATGFTVAHSVTLALAVLGWVRPAPAAVESLIGLSIAMVALENAWLAGGRGAALPAAIAVVLTGLAGAAWLGAGQLPPGVLLGLAIFAACYFGILDRSRDPAPWRVAVAFLFGLVHGFGFAGILADVALPPERLVPTLAGFNLGVEAGQLLVIAALWPLLLLARRAQRSSALRLEDVLSAGLCGIGLFWFVSRAFA